MKMRSDFSPLLTTFTAVGLHFLDKSGHFRCKILVKRALIFLSEVLFFLFALFTLFHSIKFNKIPMNYKFANICSQVALIILRISMLYKRNVILRVIKSLEIVSRRSKITKSLRKYVIASCAFCFIFPLIMSVSMIILFSKGANIQKQVMEQYFSNQTVPESTPFLNGLMFVNHVLYSLNFFVFPGLTLNLLIFLYLKYVQIFREMFVMLRGALNQNISQCMNFLTVLTNATEIYHEIENAVSFVTFIAYVMTFINFIGLIPLLSSEFLSEFEDVKETISIYIFLWTAFWFFVVTWCGAKMSEIRDDVKHFIQDVIVNFVLGCFQQNKDLLMLLLFVECAKFDLCFSGWQMFNVDRNLILTTVGVIVTYGVLFFNN